MSERRERRERRQRRSRFAFGALATFGALAALLVSACGETRSAIGEECLRSGDCLSGVCSARTCVAEPPLVTAAGDAPPAETVAIPDGDAAVFPDASDGG